MLMPSGLSAALAALMLAATAHGENFTIINGQIFTPGLAIVDAPQPNTPLGGGKFSIVFTRNNTPSSLPIASHITASLHKPSPN